MIRKLCTIGLLSIIFANLSFASETKQNIDQETINLIAKKYQDGKDFTKNDNVAFDLYKFSADNGNIQASYELAKIFAKGQGVAQDYKEAYKWLSIAAKGGHEKAIASLGAMYAEEPKPLFKPVVKDNKSIVINVQEKLKNQEALNIFDVNYDNETTVNLLTMAVNLYDNEKHSEAFYLFNILAKPPYLHPTAQYYAGLIYENKNNENYDISKAYDMFQQSSESKNADSTYKIGTYFLEGKVVKQDKHKAFETFLKAAEQGSSSAAYKLGYMFEKSQGVQYNIMEAYRWYYTGAVALNEQSLKAQQKLNNRMPPADIKTAKKIAHQWMNNYPNNFKY